MSTTPARPLPLQARRAVRPFLSIACGLLLAACGHTGAGAPTSPPVPIAAAEPVEPEPAEPAEPVEPAESSLDEGAVADATPVGKPASASAQKITFDDDADPEPTTHIQSAPKRPPMPRFRLFGTREGDGPN